MSSFFPQTGLPVDGVLITLEGLRACAVKICRWLGRMILCVSPASLPLVFRFVSHPAFHFLPQTGVYTCSGNGTLTEGNAQDLSLLPLSVRPLQNVRMQPMHANMHSMHVHCPRVANEAPKNL